MSEETVPADDMPPWMRKLNDDAASVIPLMPAKKKPAVTEIPPPAKEPAKSGILNINKPAGQTSHDVVQAVRRASGIRRVGHAGTLDPMATGVLVVCIGSATRVVDAVQAQPKRYRARLRFGQTTDTYDAEGKILIERDPSGLDLAQIESALAAFRGDILQVPPMYSALKQDGKRLYELARAGKEVVREARPVRVDSLEIIAWEAPELEIEMQVSKGTYVRSIAYDLGEALGVGAHLTALERTAVGTFLVEEAERLPRVVEAFLEGWWPSIVHALDSALLDLSAMQVDADRERAMRLGQQFDGQAPEPGTSEELRVYDEHGVFIGLATWDAVHLRWQPSKVFPKAEP
jgi:tRNA pseudouridine55 synthase